MPRPAIGWRAWSIGCTSTRCWPAAATVRISAGWAASIRPRRTIPSPRTIGCWRPGSRWRTTDRRRRRPNRSGSSTRFELAAVSPQGAPSGPDYPHYWIDKVRPGLARLWPLPWPGRYDRAGWRTILVSWLLMLLIAALAVLIAILIFRNQPPQTPPTPTGGSGSPPPSASASPQSGSPQSGSPQSGSPSGSASGSPSGSQSGSPSGSPSPSGGGSASPSGTESGGGQPTPSASGDPGNSSPGSRL